MDGAVRGLDQTSTLDKKTEDLAYLGSGIAAADLRHCFNVAMAKAAGASREEVVSDVLIGLPAVAKPSSKPAVALGAYDARKREQ